MHPTTGLITKPPDPPPQQHTDAVLVARLRSGDLRALELLMRRHNQLLFRIARSILGDEHEAMDVVQDTYVRAWYQLEQYSGTGSFAAWLCRIARNDALTRVRKARRLEYSIDDPDNTLYLVAEEAAPLEHLANQQLRTLLEAAIDRLPLDYRCVYVMRAVQELSTADTALSLGISEDLVKTRFLRARRALQKAFEAHLKSAELEVFEFAGHRCDAIVGAVLARLSN